MTTDPGYAVRHETGNAVRRLVRRLVRAAGGEFAERPVLRSDPDGRKVPEPEPLAGITACGEVEREARRLCLEYARYAREDGLGWREIGLARGWTADPGPALRAFRYAVPGHAAADWFAWTCPSCRRLVRDYGPELGPYEAEQGHGEGCRRFAATVRAWGAQWDEDGDVLTCSTCGAPAGFFEGRPGYSHYRLADGEPYDSGHEVTFPGGKAPDGLR